jgi:hypothetical protein
MPQTKWEKAFWAAARGSEADGFTPYSWKHWYKPKTNRKRKKATKTHAQRKKTSGNAQLTLFA